MDCRTANGRRRSRGKVRAGDTPKTPRALALQPCEHEWQNRHAIHFVVFFNVQAVEQPNGRYIG